MLFNSLMFWFFFFGVYAIYWALRPKSQNNLLLIASYIFYGAWDWRFLFLLMLSTVLDFYAAQWIARLQSFKARTALLCISLSINLGVLAFFKYIGFIANNIERLSEWLGVPIRADIIQVVLPVGISFYTFQTMSYVIDVYRRQMMPVQSLRDFALFISFFPQLVAGPIERATALVPQVISARKFNLTQFYSGSWLIFWGLFKKVVLADNAAQIADIGFSNSTHMPGWVNLLGVYAFAVQIYGDFSGYSDIARGLAKWMGFELMINFKAPYLAVNPSDFWKRWHVSLSTWLRDYLYIPLGGNRKGEARTYFNLLLTMFLGGLWHGAAWTFIVWGIYHALLLIVHRYLTQRAWFMRIRALNCRWIKIFFMFHWVCLGWIFFRANSLTGAIGILRNIFFNFQMNDLMGCVVHPGVWIIAVLLGLSCLIYYYNHSGESLRWELFRIPIPLRSMLYLALCYVFILFGVFHAQQFIYFQF